MPLRSFLWILLVLPQLGVPNPSVCLPDGLPLAFWFLTRHSPTGVASLVEPS